MDDLEPFLRLIEGLGFQVEREGAQGANIEGASTVYIRRDGTSWHAYPDVDGYGEFGTADEISRAVLSWLLCGAKPE